MEEIRIKPDQKYIDAGIYKLSPVNVPWLDKPVESYDYDMEKLGPLFREFFWMIDYLSNQKLNSRKESIELREADYDRDEYIQHLKDERQKALEIRNNFDKWLAAYKDKRIINFIAVMGDEFVMGYFTKSEPGHIYFDKLEVYRDLIKAETNRKVAEYLKQRIDASKPVNEKPGPKSKYNDLKQIIKDDNKLDVIGNAIAEYLIDGDVYKLPAIVSVLNERKHFRSSLKKGLKFMSVVKFLHTHYGIQDPLPEGATVKRGVTESRKDEFKAILDTMMYRKSKS